MDALLIWVVGNTLNTQAHRCTLIPVYKPPARRFGHLVSEKSALLGILPGGVLFASWLAPVPRQAARGEYPQAVRVQREIRGLALLVYLRVLPSYERC